MDVNGTEFLDLPSCLVIDILLQLPLKTQLICRYFRKDWNRLYFSDPDLVKLQLASSPIHFLRRGLEEEGKFRFQIGCVVDEVSDGNLHVETLDFAPKLLLDQLRDSENWCVVNSCNGLLCLKYECFLRDEFSDRRSVFVCNPILGEWVSMPFPSRNFFDYEPNFALGFSAKNNQYKILYGFILRDDNGGNYGCKVYTLGTRKWRNIKAKKTTRPWSFNELDCNTLLYGSLHWIAYSGRDKAEVTRCFDFETEKFRRFPLRKPQSRIVCGCSVRSYERLPEPQSRIVCVGVQLGVMNGCLWAFFYNQRKDDDAKMWAMKEYGVEKSWSMIIAIRDHNADPPNEVLLSRNKEVVIYDGALIYHDHLFSLNER